MCNKCNKEKITIIDILCGIVVIGIWTSMLMYMFILYTN